jgi:hypothetical protein
MADFSKEWVTVAYDTSRLEVPGGWLYKYGQNSLVFVPYTVDDWTEYREKQNATR